MPRYSFAKPYYNTAPAANTVATEEAWNVYFEQLPQGGYAIRRRPGLTNLDSPDLTGRGLYWSDRMKKLYFARDGQIYVKTSFNTAPVLIGALVDTELPVIFAEGQTLLLEPIIYVANGDALQYIDTATNTLVTPTGAPDANFVAMMNNRFYANDIAHSQDFLITDVNPGAVPPAMDVTYWTSAVNPFRAAQKPDPITGLFTGWNEVFVWGSTACEVWQEDGVTPVSPLVGSLMEIGLDAPYSVIMADNTFYALASVYGKRAVVTVQGRAPHVISEPIANVLQSYDYTDDAIGSLCFVGGLNFYILSFPTEGVTWAYDIKTEVWSKWSTWDLENAQHLMFNGQFGCYAKTWNKHLTLAGNGGLYEFSRQVYSDDGNPIRSSIRTGWLDHGTSDRKRSDQLIIKLQGYNPNPASILLRWRSDGFQEWSVPLELRIEANQQNDHYCKLNRMGMYRSRQYEFIMTDAADLALVSMEEDLTRMRN